MFRALRQTNYHKSIRIALFVLFIVTVLLLLPENSDTEYAQGCPSRVSQRYGIMLDAGSQGSRIHVYQFSSCGKKVLSVLNEVFEQIKPGLSAFGDKPAMAKTSLIPLMDKALESVPRHLHQCTPLALKATAGLRMLSDDKADVILEHVKDHLQSYPFLVDSVNVMEGSEEGVSAWITVNFLLNSFHQNDGTAMIMDMGGGSTQIVFETKNLDLHGIGKPQFASKISFDDKTYHLYQHSYLGFGMMEARKRILEKVVSAHSAGSDIQTACLPVGYVYPFESASKGHVSILGKKGTFEDCHQTIRQVMQICLKDSCSFGNVYQPDLIAHGQTDKIYGFSFFFDRIEPLIHSDRVKVSQVKDLAEKMCFLEMHDIPSSRESEKLTQNPFYCLELTYIYALWKEGYKIPEDRDVILAKKIKSFETGWALGETIRLMEKVSSQCNH